MDTPWRDRWESDDGAVVLYLGDCLQILPTLALVDSIVTDPVWPNAPKDSVPGSDNPWRLWVRFNDVRPACKRMVVVMRCDSDPRFLQHIDGLEFLRSMQLPYVMPGYLGRVLGGDETAYWFGEPIAVAEGRRVIPGRGPSAQPCDRPPNGHPMSRAQVHLDWLVRWASDETEIVCDPFMGSGTTGVASIRSGRRFVGIEIEPRYFGLARDRIQSELSRFPLFEPKQVSQGNLFIEAAT